MGFILFLLVTATLLIRPGEQFSDLRGAHIYEIVIVLCFVFSVSPVLQQFTLNNLESRPIGTCILGLWLAIALSHLTQGQYAQAADSTLAFFKVLIFFVLLVGNVTTVYRLHLYVIVLGFCALAFVTLAVLQYHEVITLPEPDLEAAESGLEQKVGAGKATDAFVTDRELDPETGRMVEIKRLRGTGIFRDPNDLCLLLTMGLFIAFYGLTDSGKDALLYQGLPLLVVVLHRALRYFWLVPIAVFLYAFVLTHSRGGFLSAVAGCMALFYARYGWRRTALLCVPVLSAFLILFGGRMTSLSTSEGTAQIRIQIWSDAMEAMRTAPLFGVGLNELGGATQSGRAAHNSFVGAYAELGMFGGTLFFGAFFFALATLNRLLKQRQLVVDAELARFLPFLAAMVVSYGVGILSLSRIDAVPTYLLLGLVVATGNLVGIRAPALGLRLDGRLIQRMAFASVAFFVTSYMFVRVFRT